MKKVMNFFDRHAGWLLGLFFIGAGFMFWTSQSRCNLNVVSMFAIFLWFVGGLALIVGIVIAKSWKKNAD